MQNPNWEFKFYGKTENSRTRTIILSHHEVMVPDRTHEQLPCKASIAPTLTKVHQFIKTPQY